MDEAPDRMDRRVDEPKHGQQQVLPLPLSPLSLLPQQKRMRPALKPKQQIRSRITRNSRTARTKIVIRMITLLDEITNSASSSTWPGEREGEIAFQRKVEIQ